MSSPGPGDHGRDARCTHPSAWTTRGASTPREASAPRRAGGPGGWARATERIGLPGLVLPHKNSSARVPKPSVTDDDRAYIHAHLGSDYERFGYEGP